MTSRFNVSTLAGWLGVFAFGLASAGDAAPVKSWPGTPLRGIDTTIHCDTPGGFLDETFFKQLKAWNVNILRVAFTLDRGSPWQVKRDQPVPPIPADDPMAPYKKNLAGLEQILELARQYDVHVVVALFDVVGRNSDVMLTLKDGDEGYYANIAPVWRHIAERFGRHPNLLAYDILNEPNSHHAKIWTQRLAQETVDLLRAIDPDTTIIYEPAPWALPDQAFANLQPLKGERIVYSFHFYYPHAYTHQNIGSYRAEEYVDKPYPGPLKLFPSTPAKPFDKAELEKTMANAIAFQKKHGVKLFIGEFGVLRWAPGAEAWLRDTIEIFEKHGWDWTFHSVGEWNGWNPTFDAKDAESKIPLGGKDTPMLRVLTEYWAKNR